MESIFSVLKHKPVRVLLSSLLVSLFSIGCIGTLAGGSGTEDGNATRISGKVIDKNNSNVPRAVVRLVPAAYNPVSDSSLSMLRLDTTDASGSYEFTNADSGLYNINIVLPSNGTRALTKVAVAKNATVHAPTASLAAPGAISVSLPENADAAGYVYIPGTLQAMSVTPGQTVVFDSVPAGTMEVVFVNSSTNTRSTLKDSVTVTPDSISAISPFDNWKFSKLVYINTSATGANTLSDCYGFPLAVKLDKSNFDFSAAKADGADLRFSKQDGTPLSYEIGYWNASAESAAIWVNIDTVYANNATQHFIMHWGNSTASAKSSGAGAFDTARGFSAVFHCEDQGGPSLIRYREALSDSAIGLGVGVPQGTGIMGKGLRFNNDSASFVNVEVTPGLNLGSGDFTISLALWVDSTYSRVNQIFGRGAPSDIDGYIQLQMNPGNRLKLFIGSQSLTVDTPLALKPMNWSQVIMKRENGIVSMYVNGLRNSATITSTYDLDSYAVLYLGIYLGLPMLAKEPFKGTLDECCFAKKAFSDAWIRLSYENLRSGSAVVTFK